MRPESLPFSSPPMSDRHVTLLHDESGFTARDRYGVHGMLAVPDRLLPDIGRALAAARRDHGHFTEVHFTDLGGSRPMESPQWLVARDWLAMLFGHLFTQVRYKAFVVDMRHSEFDKTRYPSPLAAYRRFFITNAKAIVAWCLRGPGSLTVTPFTDAGNGFAQRHRRRDGTLFDSFARYVVAECERERLVNGKRFYPDLVVVNPLLPVDSSPSKLSQKEAELLGMSIEDLRVRSDLIQLTDLVTAGLNAAFTYSPRNRGKQELAQVVVEGFSRAFDLPWDDALPLRRRFSVSCFPGPGRTPYAISLRGVRHFGIEYLRSHPEVAERIGPRRGVRSDAVTDGRCQMLV